MRRHNGVAAHLKEGAFWLLAVHCFNPRLELAVQDAFSGLKAFEDIDEMLLKLDHYYQKSPERLRGLKKLFQNLQKLAELDGLIISGLQRKSY